MRRRGPFILGVLRRSARVLWISMHACLLACLRGALRRWAAAAGGAGGLFFQQINPWPKPPPSQQVMAGETEAVVVGASNGNGRGEAV